MPKKKLKKTTKLFPFSPYIVHKNSEPKETFDEFKFRVEMMPFFLLIREYRIQCEEYGMLRAKDENLWTDPVKNCWERLLFVEKQMGDRYNSLHQQMECSNYNEDLAWEELYKERNKNNVKVFKKSPKQD